MARSNNPRRSGHGAQNLDSLGRVNRFVHKAEQKNIAKRFYRAGRRAAGLAGG